MKNNCVYPIWKPPGISSYDVIRELKKYLNEKTKLGHCGTLDPFAEGVLIVCADDELKNVSNYMSLTKKYTTDIIFGKETDTLDPTGKIINTSKENDMINIENIKNIMDQLMIEYKQSPPYYSAKKINGIRLYKLARKNIYIKPKGSNVKIHSYNLNKLKNDFLQIEVSCSAGLYIRSLARDIAQKLNTYAYVDKLTRDSVGSFTKDNSINFYRIKECCLSIN